MYDRKTIIKIANTIRQALAELNSQGCPKISDQLQSFVSKFQELDSQSRKLGKALAHSWQMAAEKCCSGAHRLLSDISYLATSLRQATENPLKQIPKLHLLVEELDQLQAEFGDMEFDRESNTLSVITESITLEDIYLGPFRIQLELNKLGQRNSSFYYCVALEPNPAATDESVTHPHVSNEQLCEGDGSEAIITSLEQGRLCDFFAVIRSILNTYNPDSPYVSLSEWEGITCYDCGCVVSSDNAYYCEHCDYDFCESCSTYCHSCDTTVCLGCSAECPCCGEIVCSSCIAVCPQCEGDCCRLCLDECSECQSQCCQDCLENGLCPNCRERKETEENEKQQEENQAKTDQQNENKIQPQTTTALVKLAG